MNTAFRIPLMMACLLALSGCSSVKPKLAPPDLARGGHVFDTACAECHLDADNNEAPQLDEPGDWDLRLQQWAAIMDGHAKQGYLAAKGGHTALSEQNVADVLYFIETKVKAEQ